MEEYRRRFYSINLEDAQSEGEGEKEERVKPGQASLPIL
jgi:hypothetical protein